MKPETKFRQNKVIPFLKKLKRTKRFPIQQLSISGTPDFLLCSHGRFVALELKDTGQVPTRLQQSELDAVTRAGGIAIVATPENWSEVKQQLLELDKGEKLDGDNQGKVQGP